MAMLDVEEQLKHATYTHKVWKAGESTELVQVGEAFTSKDGAQILSINGGTFILDKDVPNNPL